MAAGLFDNPWLVAVIIIISALANWLSQRRAAKAEAEAPPETDTATPPESADWEARLRRMLGEAPANPPVIGPPPVPVGRAQPPLLRPGAGTFTTGQRPPFVEIAPELAVETAAPSRGVERAIRRYEQRLESQTAPARASRATGSRNPNALGAALRQPQAARQAFIASLVFGPPKALEVER